MNLQETAILGAIKDTGKADWVPARDKLLIKLLFATDLRCCELLGLTVADVDPEQGLKVRRWPSGKEEFIALPSSLAAELGLWVADLRPTCEHLGMWPKFIHAGKRPGEPMPKDCLALMLNKRATDAGLSAWPARIRAPAPVVDHGPQSGHLAAYLLSRRNATRADRTVDWYERHLKHWLRWLAATGNLTNWLEPDTLDLYLGAERARGLANSSVKSRFDCIKAFLRWLRKRRRIRVHSDDLPTAIVDSPQIKSRRPRQANYLDLQKVISSIPEGDWLGYRDKCILTLMLTTGLRVDEVINVRAQDIDLIEGFVFVESGKGEKPRIVPFDSQFRLAYVGWIYNRPATAGDKLFMRADRWKHPLAQAISTDAVRIMLKHRCLAAKVTYINPHSIRHLFAIKALNDGVQLSAVSAMMGHESVAFTAKRYAKWMQSGLRREYDNHWKVGGKESPTTLQPATVPQPA